MSVFKFQLLIHNKIMKKKMLLTATFIFAFAFGYFQSLFLHIIEILGFRIPSPHIQTDYVTALLWAIALTLLLFVLPLPQNHRKPLLILWAARIGTTLIAMLFYEYKYGLDAYSYFKYSLNDSFIWRVQFGYGTEIISWISWLLNHYLPVNNSYHTLKVIFSFTGLLAAYIFYRGFTLYTQKERISFLYLLGLFPSILFWSSILGKDPVTLLGIAIYSFGVFWLLHAHSPWSLLTIAFGLFLASSIRVWSGLIFLIPLFPVYFKISSHSIFKKLTYTTIITILLLVFSNTFLTEFNIESSTELLTRAQYHSRSWSRGGSGQEVPEFHSFKDMLKFSPKGIFTALFRPLPGEINNFFGVFAGFENLILFILFLYAIYYGSSFIKKDPALLWLGSLILTWAFVYGFISYQNLGSAVRFKLQIMPHLLAFIYLLLQNHRQDKIKSFTRGAQT
ncbi:MAG: hypothetical protein D6797_04870 [Bdellovibrio sp.]|nr:MAG: hypothetical protein D6797_04870 [Bdellovibrio sp.]